MVGQARVRELIRRRYARGDLRYVCAEDVTHPNGSTADCLAVETTGIGQIIGHEIQTCRRDWVVEMCNLANSALWRGLCHRWLLVVSDESIVHDGELPEGWGLLVAGPTRLRLRVRPSVIAHPRPVAADEMQLIRQAAAMTPQADFLRAG